MPFSSASSSSLVHHRIVILSAATGLLLALSGVVSPAVAAGWDVCAHGCRYDQVGPALAASRDGDTIRVGPGVYTGGLTITSSVTVVGSGRDSTVISGGGPVLTIGTFGAVTAPTVSIRGVTLTGGVSRTSAQSVFEVGEAGVIASGGGVEIQPGPDFGPGATVWIADSAITGNRVAPVKAVPVGPSCPPGPCPFAQAMGGGIDSWGNLTLVGTSVSHNRIGTASGLSDLARNALGGAIEHHAGDLTIRDSSLEDNQVSASAPNGRYVDTGAVIAEGYTVTMSHDVFRGNSATLNAGLADTADSHAQSGAVNVGTDVSAATIRDTEFSDNSVTMTNTAGDSFANSGAVHGDVLLTLSGDVFAHNSVVSQTLPGSPGNAQGDSGGGEVSGTVTGTSFTGNTVTVRSAAGDVNAWAGAAIFSGTLTQSLVNDNRVVAASPRGTATLDGAGLQAGDFAVTLQNTDVTGNTGVATGRTGTARGGGIFDSPVTDGPPGGRLRLASSHITRNTLTGGPGVTVSGGGVFSTYRVALADSVIARNSPDQCVGC